MKNFNLKMWSKGLALCLVCVIAFPLLSSCNQEKKDHTKIAESSTLEEKNPDVCESDSCEKADVTVDSLKDEPEPCPYCQFLDEMEEMNENRGNAYKNLNSFLKWRNKYAPAIQKAYRKLLPKEKGSMNIDKLLYEVDKYLDGDARSCPMVGSHTTSFDFMYNYEMQNNILLYAIATEYLPLVNDSIYRAEINAWMKFVDSYMLLYSYKVRYPSITASGWLENANILGYMTHLHKCRLQNIRLLKDMSRKDILSRRNPQDAFRLYKKHLDKLSISSEDDIEEYNSIVKEEFGYPTVEYGLNVRREEVKRALLRWVRIREELYKDDEKMQKWANYCTVKLLTNLSKEPPM